jgi:hypothetical protein
MYKHDKIMYLVLAAYNFMLGMALATATFWVFEYTPSFQLGVLAAACLGLVSMVALLCAYGALCDCRNMSDHD